MPLPMMPGDPGTMLMQPGMQPPAPAAADPGLAPGAAPVDQGAPQQADPRAQARGAVELISQAKTQFAATMEGLARQFPGTAKSANQAVLMLDKALQDVLREVLTTLQSPEPAAPVTLH